jgi:sugar (pentulose or hexulose) kinase
VQPVQRALPNAAAHAAYDTLFVHYQAAYPALKPLMHGLRHLPGDVSTL